MKTKLFLVTVVAIFMVIASTRFHASPISKEDVLAHRTISLDKRYNNTFVNSVFKDNILLTLAYLHGQVNDGHLIKWGEIQKPTDFELTLNPGKTFAYHDTVLPQYQGKIAYSTHAHFNGSEGFKSDGYLMGDGVCHLASLINWVAQDAGLTVEAPVKHDFAVIPEVPEKYGTSIYTVPNEPAVSAEQNLYVTNNRSAPVVLKFDYDGQNLTVSILSS